jgi:hypothetical protein
MAWNILASLDDGASFDVALKSDANVAFGAKELYSSSVYYTHWKIQFKSQSSGSATTALLKIAALGT